VPQQNESIEPGAASKKFPRSYGNGDLKISARPKKGPDVRVRGIGDSMDRGIELRSGARQTEAD